MTLPADLFVSIADYAAWCAQNQPLLRRRAAAAMSLAGPREATCAPCLRATGLTDGHCDCAQRLDGSERALLHAAESLGLCRWSHLVVVADGDGLVTQAVTRRLLASSGAGRVLWELPVARPSAEADFAVAGLVLARAPAMLAWLREALLPGGCLLAPVTLRLDQPRSRDGVFGWDVLDLVRRAGFADVALLRPWSRELGYDGCLHLLQASRTGR